MTGDYRLLLRRTGGPDALEQEPVVLGAPGPGEARVRHQAIGLNYIDTYHRSGLYPVPLPSGLGTEAAGIVEAVGDGVTGVRPGDRVAYAGGPLGAYATVRMMPAAALVPLPEDITADQAAAVMLKGMTADMLVGPCSRIRPGQTALVHAAAGGVGSILVQWLKSVGAIVIAHAGSEAKAAVAAGLGADSALSCPYDTLAEAVRTATNGRGVDVAFDGVGAASWQATLASMAKRGLIVSYGNASGPVPPIAPLELGRAGSLFLTRPSMFDYTASPDELRASAGRLFELIASNKIGIGIGQRFPLSEAAAAHRALESRTTTGSTLLIP